MESGTKVVLEVSPAPIGVGCKLNANPLRERRPVKSVLFPGNQRNNAARQARRMAQRVR